MSLNIFCRSEVISHIEDVIVQITHQISSGVPPFLQLRWLKS